MPEPSHPLRIDIWHNLLWSKYKGEVFSSLWSLTDKQEFSIRFTQIAKTDHGRALLAGVDMTHHRYPFNLLFDGAFSDQSLLRRLAAILPRTLLSDAQLVILSGYERVDCWVQLLILKMRRRKVALFLDSTLNEHPERMFRRLLKRIFISSVDGVFGYGVRTKEYAVNMGARPQRVFVPCQAAALEPAYWSANALEARRNADISPAAPRFLYVGRLIAEKGLDDLLKAMHEVLQALPSATLVLVGNGALREQLEARARCLLPADAVFFLGSRTGSELYAEYTRATALVLPSTSEPWGLVVNEALAYGCPVVVSDRCGCVPELVLEGVTGYKHRAFDPTDLARKMLLVPDHLGDLEKTAGQCQALVSRYTPDRAAREILEGCRQLLS